MSSFGIRRYFVQKSYEPPSEPFQPDPNNQDDVDSCGISPEAMVIINDEVTATTRKRKRGTYQHYDDEHKTKIARYAILNHEW